MRVSLKKVLPFIIAADHSPKTSLLESDQLRFLFLPTPKQMELNFAHPASTPMDALMARSGEM